jgi:bla regulator protein blaR1
VRVLDRPSSPGSRPRFFFCGQRGPALFLAHWLRQWWRVRQIARAAVPLTSGREVEALRSLERGARRSRALPVRCTDTFLEPGIFGVVQPVLLWPRAIGERLTNEQVEAVLAHELCHLERRDNLAALLHLLVQTHRRTPIPIRTGRSS